MFDLQPVTRIFRGRAVLLVAMACALAGLVAMASIVAVVGSAIL